MRIPNLAAIPVAIITGVGADNETAHGQEMIKTKKEGISDNVEYLTFRYAYIPATPKKMEYPMDVSES